MREKKKRKTLAISQVISIILSTIAIAYILASSFPVVSAQERICEILSATGGGWQNTENINPNTWCPQNGGAVVCIGGSGAWQLKVN